VAEYLVQGSIDRLALRYQHDCPSSCLERGCDISKGENTGAVHDTRILLLDAQLFQSLIERAYHSPRLRTNHNFHLSMDDNPHRFLNVMVRGTYIAPHRHRNPPKSESFLVIDGELAFFTFDDSGQITSTYLLGQEAVGIDIQPGVWHTIAVLSPHAVCYEVKPGPYSWSDDKDFAPWAPREGDPGVEEYLEWLLEAAARNETPSTS
jgi:cupin fold WbuC family metalloprotein